MGGLPGRRIFLGVWRLMGGGNLWRVRDLLGGIGRRVGVIGLLRGRGCEFFFLFSLAERWKGSICLPLERKTFHWLGWLNL